MPVAIPKLLVSVRNAEEAAVAIAGGADWIDVKEPDRGALGMASATDIEAVARLVDSRRPISVALGELLGACEDVCLVGPTPGTSAARHNYHWSETEALLGISRAKVGLSGCRDTGDWTRRLDRLVAALPPGLGLVAVHYADWRTCGAPPPEEVLRVARRLQCPALLVDTFDKTRGGLFHHVSLRQLSRLFSTAHTWGMTTVAAGSLQPEDFSKARAAGAEVIAVRGAACRAGVRTAAVCVDRVVSLRDRLHAAGAASDVHC